MGRPRKGPWFDGKRWCANLPVAVGAKKQKTFSDPDEHAVRRWFADGERALAAGESLPDTELYRSGRNPSAQTGAPILAGLTPEEWWAGPTPAHGHRLDRVAAAFKQHRYDTLGRGQATRHDAVQADIDNDVLPFLKRHGVILVEQVTHQMAGKFAVYLAGRESATAAAAPLLWPELDGVQEVTLARAARLEGTSRSTIKRWHKAESLPSWHVDDSDGQVRISVAELRAAAHRAPVETTRRPLQTSSAANKLGVLKMILDFAAACGVPLTGTPMADIFAVAPENVRSPDDELPYVPLSEFPAFAAHMSVVQQLTMWLERILGVRIGEGFGPHVGDVLDFGGDEGGCIVLDRQGGKPFTIMVAGERVVADEKDQMKTRKSHRVLALPRQVMDLVRVVIRAFHTDPVTGEVDMSARLVPGLREANRGGQQAHRSALGRAVEESGFNTDLYGPITPKRLRACLVTDLERLKVPEAMSRRYVGHIAGEDVHARYYLLDPAAAPEAMKEWRPVTEALESLIDSELSGSLLVPTAVRQIFGRQHPLRERQQYYDATLAAHGWFIEPRNDDQALLSTEQVASALGLAPTTARRRLRDGAIPGGVLVREGGRDVWKCSAEVLERHRAWLRDNPTLDEIGVELGLTYYQVYALTGELRLDKVQRVKGGDVRLTTASADRLREHHRDRAASAARCVPISLAAVELGIPVLLVETLIRRGVITVDQEGTTDRVRHVTRESVARYRAQRGSATKPGASDEPAVPDAAARAITGLTRPGLASLIAAGVLVPVMRNRRRHVTEASIEAWASTADRLEVMQRLATWRGRAEQ